MAISKPFYDLLKELNLKRILPQQCAILEIGQATWYGEAEHPRQKVLDIYQELVQPSEIVSLDMGGDDKSIKHNLNLPIELGRNFGLLFNHGTAEHVAEPLNIFRIMHNHCEAGGVMIHEAPWIGWIDHGFYNFNPTYFYDLAFDNNYRIEFIAAMDINGGRRVYFDSREEVGRAVKHGEINGNLNLFVVYRKIFDRDFVTPSQGIYAGRVSEEVGRYWYELR